MMVDQEGAITSQEATNMRMLSLRSQIQLHCSLVSLLNAPTPSMQMRPYDLKLLPAQRRLPIKRVRLLSRVVVLFPDLYRFV